MYPAIVGKRKGHRWPGKNLTSGSNMMKIKRSDNLVRRVIDRWVAFLLPDGGLSHWAFAGATTVAIVAAVFLIGLGRVSYARTDFFPLPPFAASPSVTLDPALGTEASGAVPSSPAPISGTSLGSPQAPVTIVVYSDFQCSACQQFAATTEKELESSYVATGKVRLIYKHLIVHGEESRLAAQASECAAAQGKFWPYHDLLMQMRASPEKDDLSIATLEGLAQQVGLDMAAFDASLRSGKYDAKVTSDDAEGRALGVPGTPTYFVNRMKGSGYKPFAAFQKVVEELLKESAS